MKPKLSPPWEAFDAEENFLLTKIQTQVMAEHELWRKVPALAWMADQLKGKYDNDISLFKVARFGLWPLCHKDCPRWYAAMWVDCESGIILRKEDLTKVEATELRPFLGKLSELDPRLVIQKLDSEIKRSSSFKTLPPCPVPDPYRRMEALPKYIDPQLVQSSD